MPLTPLDDAGRQKFLAKLCDCASGVSPSSSACLVPAGGTPTRPALQGTIGYAATVATTYPNSKTVIVFITDGEPSFACTNSAGSVQTCNSCEDLTNGCLSDPSQCLDQQTEIDGITAVIQVASAANPNSIYVTGVGSDLDDYTLSDWAAASGNDALDLRNLSGAGVAATLMAKLQSIRSLSISCAFDLPLPVSGTSINPNLVNVNYTAGDGTASYLPRTRDGSASGCSVSVNNWYFDNPTTPKKLQLCPSTCSALQQDSEGLLRVQYGCQTLI